MMMETKHGKSMNMDIIVLNLYISIIEYVNGTYDDFILPL